ncbi:hypothetical protein ALC152_14940 [Arcobacter sp. 15-2]|uniref:DUF4857 domain-containing protein n=1 Tax=Arcobacter sp. 15-2 TaxID=3374109 RepID=UPI00399D2E0E
MFVEILKKEWIKLKFYIIILLSIIISSLFYFNFNLDFAFRTIEPESMMWYKFAHLKDKPYFYLSYLFILIGVIISFAQFLPERIQNRVKVMIHLPLELNISLLYHLIIGTFTIFVLTTILAIPLLLILVQHYPDLIVQVAFKDTLAYSFIAIVVYISLSATILEKNLIVSFFKLLFTLFFIGLFLKNQYLSYDILWLAIIIIVFFLALDSLYSIKEQRITSKIYLSSLVLIFIVMLFINFEQYKKKYTHEFNNYYIFYSNIIDDFVYQKNFGQHQFEYAVQNKNKFDRLTYESYLPFVYWKNLDIQNKLPFTIKEKTFTKKQIKNSRLGFSYHPKLLKPLEVELYALLNPQTTKGMIPFPEEVFAITKKGAVVYTYDTKIAHNQTKNLNVQLEKLNFQFPALNIWGKSTNMKPFDKGYLVKDSKQELYNIQKANDTIWVSTIQYPKDIEIAYIKISENKQKKLLGYAIDTKSNFYLLDWNFKFIKLDLPKFDYKNMKLKLISNPINYLIRYDNHEDYYAVVFDKEFKKIDEIIIEKNN